MHSDAPRHSVGLSVAQWRKMAQGGADLPVRFRVTGVSMHPLIRRDRDIATVVSLRRAPKVGEVVLFRRSVRDADYVVHRVIETRGTMARTRGDNCAAPDPWIPLCDIWGLVQSVERGRVTINPNRLLWQSVVRARNGCLRIRSFCARVLRFAVRALRIG